MMDASVFNGVGSGGDDETLVFRLYLPHPKTISRVISGTVVSKKAQSHMFPMDPCCSTPRCVCGHACPSVHIMPDCS